MTRFAAAAGSLMVGVILTGAPAEAQTCYPGAGRKVVYDEWGYARPAPCERVALRSGYSPCAGYNYYGAAYSVYPPLRSAAGFDPFDRPREMSWSW